MKIYLASSSPRRIEILKEILSPFNLEFEVISPNFTEVDKGALPAELVLINARGKVKSMFDSLPENSLVISADTVVALGEEILGKPADEREAGDFLRRLSARSHSVFTGVVVANRELGDTFEGWEESTVTFRKLSTLDIERYLTTYHPYDKAGGYGIQEIGEDFVEKVKGSYSNIVGLPKGLTLSLLKKAGV